MTATAPRYDDTTSPVLSELRIEETFTGDIDGESPVRALQGAQRVEHGKITAT